VYRELSSSDINEVKKFRTRQRIPSLSYLHWVSSKKFDWGYKILAGLWRSGQIKTGIMGSRNANDEKFIKLISRLSINTKLLCLEKAQNEDQRQKYSKICVFDCRPWKNAMGNKIVGKGCLSSKNYNLNALYFGGIDNIHEMRNSHNAVLTGFEKSENWNALSVWYSHVKKVIDGALKCSNWLSEGIHVVVNCSDGWDRTPQICSTTKILLNPIHRTFIGLQTLICYEWIGYGHQF
jgi:Myotubularin-like phosphatase domain